MLVKKPDLESTFIQLCVDNGGKLPAYVQSVPFIVVHDSEGRQLRLTDANAFGWLNKQMEQLAGNFEAYDGGVMSSSLSDCYSFISDEGSVHAPVGHTFEWINEKEKPFSGSTTSGGGINTPNQDTYGGGRDRGPKSDMDKLIEMRNRDIPKIEKPREIDFSKPLSEQPKPQIRNALEYAPDARHRQTRIAAPRQGVDFQNPRFQANQPHVPQHAPARQPAVVNQPIHRAAAVGRPGINGRALPAGWNRIR